MCNYQDIFAKARLGDIVSYSDGTPQPPARHKKKLAHWKHNNRSGRLIRKEPWSESGLYFALEDLSVTMPGIARFTTVVALAPPYRFEIIEPVREGSWRVIQSSPKYHELEAVTATREEAEAYKAKQHCFDLAIDEVTGEPSVFDRVVT